MTENLKKEVNLAETWKLKITHFIYSISGRYSIEKWLKIEILTISVVALNNNKNGFVIFVNEILCFRIQNILEIVTTLYSPETGCYVHRFFLLICLRNKCKSLQITFWQLLDSYLPSLNRSHLESVKYCVEGTILFLKICIGILHSGNKLPPFHVWHQCALWLIITTHFEHELRLWNVDHFFCCSLNNK